MSIGVAYVWRWQEMLAYRRQYEIERSRSAMAKRYEYLTKYAYDMIVIMDRDWHVIEVNDRAMETYGYTPDEFYHLHLLDFFPEGMQSANETRLPEMEAARGLTFETVHVRKDGETFPVEVSSSVLVIENEQFFQHIIRDISDRKRRETVLEESEKQLRRLSSQLLIVQENERRRISKELHDELGQALMVLKFRLDSLKAGLRECDPKLEEEFQSIFGYIQEMTAMVRKLCWDLSPANLDDIGISSVLQNMLDDFAERFTVEWRHNNLPLDELFSRLARVNIFRIFQETLTNIGRHSLATRISIDVSEENGAVAFSISDDGKGFDVEKVGQGESREMGIGLASMRERARSSGGTLDIWSQPGIGTKITFSIPTKMED
jgi:PAS domain S-box-containing protein